MSIFSSILAKILPSHQSGNSDATKTGGSSSPAGSAPAPESTGRLSGLPGASLAGFVDVDAVMREMQSKHSEKLDWKASIVDLLKLLGLDSSLSARKQLATELGYSGSTDDSAAMNNWLQAQVMRKLAENGGKLPADLKG